MMIKSKGSVFDDIADTPEEAEELKAMAAIMNDLLEKLEHSTAEKLSMTEEEADHLRAGRMKKFTLGELEEIQNRC